MAGGFPAFQGPIHYPRGYPSVIATLDQIGLGVPWAFIGVNLIFLAIGTAAAFVILRTVFKLEPLWSALICCLFLLSRVVVWTTAVANSDVSFFGLAMVCLLLLVVSRGLRGGRAVLALVGASVLAAVAIEFRTIGLALLPPLLFALLTRPEAVALARTLWRKPFRAAMLGSAVLAVIVVAAVFVISGTGYASATSDGWQRYGVVTQVKDHLSVVGELALNVNRDRAPDALQDVYPVIGILALALAFTGAWIRRRNLEVTDVFVASVAIILFVWPGNDSRLWLPALPLLFGYAAIVVRRYARWPGLPAVAVGCAIVFAAIGAITLTRSVLIGLSGSRFPSVWAETAAWTEPTYTLAFTPNAPVDRSKVRRRVLLLLRRYEPRARP